MRAYVMLPAAEVMRVYKMAGMSSVGDSDACLRGAMFDDTTSTSTPISQRERDITTSHAEAIFRMR